MILLSIRTDISDSLVHTGVNKCIVKVVPLVSLIHVCLYNHNAYKHIQPVISEENKHMLSILSSLENTYSLLFSCLKSHSEV